MRSAADTTSTAASPSTDPLPLPPTTPMIASPVPPPVPRLPTYMLLALRSGLPEMPRKRFRTKFTPDQKKRMHELSEKLRWRMRRNEEGFVEKSCREIEVSKGVSKEK